MRMNYKSEKTSVLSLSVPTKFTNSFSLQVIRKYRQKKKKGKSEQRQTLAKTMSGEDHGTMSTIGWMVKVVVNVAAKFTSTQKKKHLIDTVKNLDRLNF